MVDIEQSEHPLYTRALVRLVELGRDNDQKYRERLSIECKEIEKQGLWDYFVVLVERGVKYRNENNLLIAFLLGLCDENPLDGVIKDLVWTQSNDFPDIDTDFLPQDRDEIKQWAGNRFGNDKVCSICNYATYQLKSALVDVSRIFEIPLAEVRAITTKMDNSLNKMEFQMAKETYGPLKEFLEKSDVHKTVGKVVERLLGRHYRLGAHAAGIVIADRPLTDVVPLVQRDGKVMSAWAEGQATSDLKTVGLVKFDILGLENLNYIKTGREVIRDIWRRITFEGQNGAFVDLEKWRIIGEKRVEDLKVGDPVTLGKFDCRIKSITPIEIDFEGDDSYLNDKEALAMANRGELISVFQFDSDGIREIAKRIGIKEFEDLVSATCLFRPGPLESGMVEEFINRRSVRQYRETDQKKKGRSLEDEKDIEQKERQISDIHPILRPILEKTEGIALYQEQTMQIFHAVGGISLPNCEKIRKAMGQKRVSEFLKFKDEFIETGSKRLGWTEKRTTEFWDKIEKSSGYLFNRSHGVVYTIVSMQCLYLKAHYPREYFSAVLSHLDPGDDRIGIYMREAKRLGIEFVPVDINRSKMGFTIAEDGKVYFGFNKIKGVGSQAEAIIQHQPYQSFEDFIARFGLGKRVCEPLIKLGAFDCFNPNRKALWSAYELQAKQKSRKNKQALEVDNTLGNFNPVERSQFEGQYYGLFFNHPLGNRRRSGFSVSRAKENLVVEIYISDMKVKKTKTGKPYYSIYGEDETGNITINVWENQYKLFSGLLKVGECISMELRFNEKYFDMKRSSEPRTLRLLDQISESEQFAKEYQDDYEKSLQSIKDAMNFSPTEEDFSSDS